ncbi:hypothetical protein EIP91_003129 [Steccherinum ochraceum]|uniref:Uncharacterized protein n=1 Tax=Steccherinum ochraceum TaxID=92696 RepID=A0A4R0RUP3_9APHY|nr:hypothetical protein EIP91_003129 [Steccherinum ochraceum]
MLLQSAQRPVKTYSHRRSRAHANVARASEPQALSSPQITQHPHNDDDLTLAEFSRTMKKRSELRSLHAADKISPGDSQNLMDEDHDSLEMPRNCALEPFHSNTNPDSDDPCYETPYVSLPQDPSHVASTLHATSPDRMSPVPASRRILSRIGSRNLKENLSRNDQRGLASPFHSRPGSRAASPDFVSQGPAKRPRLHTKSRTLSSDMLSRNQAPVLAVAPAVLQNKPQVANHNRTASIPTIPSASLDDFDPQSWLVPPQALSRSPSSILAQLDDPQHEHPSFYFDAPAAVSTPARKTRATTSIYTDDSLGLGEEPSLAQLIPLIAPKQPGRRRRRTIMQAPDDSLFSSMLDFSAYITDEESPNHIRRSQGPSSVAQDLPHVSVRSTKSQSFSTPGLGSAFSPSSEAVPMDEEVLPPSSPLNLFGYASSPQRKELSSLLTSMDITDVYVAPDEEVAPLDADAVYQQELASSSNLKPGHRRKRGDTIRASDFTRPSALGSASSVDILPSASSDNIQIAAESSNPKPGPRNPQRRVRSGTITLANLHENTAPSPPSSPGIIERIVPRIKPEPSRHRRRRDGPPQFKRTIHDKPITPQKSDSSDDELLLTRHTIWKDPQAERTRGG